MPKFRKKPAVIEAEQYTKYGILVKGMCNSRSCFTKGNIKPHVHTIHDDQIVNLEIGDWIIPEPDGKHFYPIKPDILKDTYDIFDPFDGEGFDLLHADEAGAMDSVPTDTERLNKLQSLSQGHGGGWILRVSTTGRGMRLHESEIDGTYPDVRLAIDAYHPLMTSLKFDNEPKKLPRG
jgi:hypothetical protein